MTKKTVSISLSDNLEARIRDEAVRRKTFLGDVIIAGLSQYTDRAKIAQVLHDRVINGHEDDSPIHRTSVRMEPEPVDNIRKIAKGVGIAHDNLVRIILDDYLQQHRP